MKEKLGHSRREFIKTMAIAGLAASLPLEAKVNWIDSRIDGVYVGMQTYSLRGLRYQPVIGAMREVGIGECELFSMQVEPTRAEVPDIVKWRATVPLDFFHNVRKQFNDAGIAIHAYNPFFGDAFHPGPPAPPKITDEEIGRLFQFAKALGAETINSRIHPSIAGRVARFAEKYDMIVGSTSQDAGIIAASKYYRYDFDIGDYAHAGHDPLPFVLENYEKITDIHLKDCKLNGPSVPFGEGDSHMKEILRFLKEKQTGTRANIDCDYPGTGTSVEEVKRCFDFVKGALA
jgi:sugar phosphate isomerase/epimerase